jgi:hypothetical protein
MEYNVKMNLVKIEYNAVNCTTGLGYGKLPGFLKW